MHDGIWKGIKAELNQRPIISDWRLKMFQYMGVACVFFLFIRNCTPYQQSNNKVVYSELSAIAETDESAFKTNQNEKDKGLSRNVEIQERAQSILSTNEKVYQIKTKYHL